MLIDLKWDAAEVTVVIMAGIPTFLSVECKWAAKLKELKVYPTDLITVQSVFFPQYSGLSWYAQMEIYLGWHSYSDVIEICKITVYCLCYVLLYTRWRHSCIVVD